MQDFTLSPDDFTLKQAKGINSILDKTIADYEGIDAVLFAQEMAASKRRAQALDTAIGVQDATDISIAQARVSDKSNGGTNREAPTTRELESTIGTKAKKSVDVPTSVEAPESKAKDDTTDTTTEAPEAPEARDTSEMGIAERGLNALGRAVSGLVSPDVTGVVAGMVAGPAGVIANAAVDMAVGEETPFSDLMDQVTRSIDEANNIGSTIGSALDSVSDIAMDIGDALGVTEATKHDAAEEGTGLGGGGRSSSNDASKGSTRGHSNTDNDAGHQGGGGSTDGNDGHGE